MPKSMTTANRAPAAVPNRNAPRNDSEQNPRYSTRPYLIPWEKVSEAISQMVGRLRPGESVEICLVEFIAIRDICGWCPSSIIAGGTVPAQELPDDARASGGRAHRPYLHDLQLGRI